MADSTGGLQRLALHERPLPRVLQTLHGERVTFFFVPSPGTLLVRRKVGERGSKRILGKKLENVCIFKEYGFYYNGMYGLINRAIKDFVIERAGEPAWKRVHLDAGVQEDEFVAMESYSDASTYALIGSASRLLDVPQEEILKEFGRKWITYTADRGYGELMDGWGLDVGSFLDNLNQMHARLKLAMPRLEPPHFEVFERGQNSLILRYWSDRPGLSPMVIGLLEGLGQRFGTPVEVELRSARSVEQDHDEFFVTWQASAPGST